MGNMEDYKLRKVINDYMKEACHYSQKQVFANSMYQRNYFQQQIDEATTGLINFLQLYYNSDSRRQSHSAQEDLMLIDQYVDDSSVSQNNIPVNTGMQPEMQPEFQPGMQPETQPENTTGTGEQRQFTAEELSQYNGMNGNPTYVAVNGVVYDLSNVARWAGGSHFGLVAGQDHTSDFMGCHGGLTERLQLLPVVGTLVTT